MVANLQDLSWNLAILFGWLAILPLALAWHAGKKLQASLKAPLTESAEQLTHLWEHRVTRWTTIGLCMSGFSILCFVVWLFSALSR